MKKSNKIKLRSIFAMKGIAFAVFLLFASGSITAQGEKEEGIPVDTFSVKKKHNAFYFELLGNAGLYSLNYERLWLRKERFVIGTRLGAGFIPNGLHLDQSYVLEQNFCYGKETRFIEAGLGYTLKYEYLEPCAPNESASMDKVNWGMARLGVKFISDDKGSIFRIGLLAIFYYKDKCETDWAHIQPYGGISYGFLFGKRGR